MVGHVYVKFGDPSCIGLLRYCAEKQSYTQTNTNVTDVTVGNTVVFIY